MNLEEWEYEKSVIDQQFAFALYHRVSLQVDKVALLGTCTKTQIHPTLQDTMIFVEFDCGYSEWMIPNNRNVSVHFSDF